jgi:tryptophanyl-tRNA synthetase
MAKPVILTGLRANSEFHIGNYLGAILPVVELQNKHAGEYQVNMFVPDLHSFTTPIDHSKLYQQTIDNLRVFTAAGLDINNPDTFIYRQSFISAHSELTWILDCFTGFGELSRMTQFKDKGQDNENATAGLYNYPVLMAADILLYGAKYVPVGEDQRQHLELTRDLAIRLNNKFEQELFIVPEPWDKQLEFANRDKGVRIRSLRNPEKKMSKSIDDPSGTIMLSDSPEEAAKKIMRAETDSLGKIAFDFKDRPGVSNLLQMLALLSDRPQKEIIHEWEGRQTYGELKKAVADKVENFLHDFQEKLNNIDEQAVLSKLEDDENKMCDAANTTLYNVQKAVGLRK